MSTKVQDIVWDLAGVSHTQKLMLIALADQGNDYGEGYPGIETLKRMCSLSERGVFKVLAELEESGLVAREKLPGKNTLFVLNLERLLQPDLLHPFVTETSRGRARHARHLHHVQGCTTGRGAPRAGVHGVHPAQRRIPTPAPRAVSIKATIEQKHPVSSAGARDDGSVNEQPGNSGEFVQGEHADRVGQLEGHANPSWGPQPPAAAVAIAVELRKRGYACTARDPDLLDAVAEGVTPDAVFEFADLYPAEHVKCRGSPGYVLGAARRQRAEAVERSTTSTTPVPRGTKHGNRRESDADRIARLGRELDEREATATG